MAYRQLPAWQTRIACRGIPANSNFAFQKIFLNANNSY